MADSGTTTRVIQEPELSWWREVCRERNEALLAELAAAGHLPAYYPGPMIVYPAAPASVSWSAVADPHSWGDGPDTHAEWIAMNDAPESDGYGWLRRYAERQTAG